MTIAVHAADCFLGAGARHFHFWVVVWVVSPVSTAPREAPGGV